MNIELNDADRAFASRIHQLYKKRPGASHIASEFALAYMSALVRETKPSTVLEFGAGIGTLTHALLSHSHKINLLVSTENNDFCLEQLARNVPAELTDRWKLVGTLGELDGLADYYDLVVFDGGFYRQEELSLLSPGSVCFVEGSRRTTRDFVRQALAQRNLDCDLRNFHGGYRYFACDWVRDVETGKGHPRFQFRKARKGCWIGQVIEGALNLDEMAAR